MIEFYCVDFRSSVDALLMYHWLAGWLARSVDPCVTPRRPRAFSALPVCVCVCACVGVRANILLMFSL